MKKLLMLSSVLVIVAGAIMILGGIVGFVFTYNNVVREDITTPADASIPTTPVRGPLTLKSQADIIRLHVLRMTNGETYSQMPQKIPKVDKNGSFVLDDKGVVIMVPNDARNIWITATTLITALNLGIIAYAFSALVFCLGLIFTLAASITLFVLKRSS